MNTAPAGTRRHRRGAGYSFLIGMDPTRTYPPQVMPVSKKHHYTPRYYLKRFEDSEGGLWRRDVETGVVVKGNNERFGFKNQWNTLRNPPPGYAPDWAERRMAEIDGFASAILNQILSGELPPDIRALAHAISFMVHNNPRLMREIEEKHADRITHWTNDFWLVVKLKTALDAAHDYEPLFYAVQTIDPSDASARFLTSNNPIIDFSNKPTMLLPVSNRHCLFLSRDPPHRDWKPGFMICDRAVVAGINRKTIENAWQYLYSSTPDFEP